MSALPSVESRDVPLSAIKLPKGFNLREEIDLEGEEMIKLSLSIQKAGLITPLIVQENGSKESFQLVCGFRRYAAMKSLGIRGTVPVRVLAFDAAADAVIMNIVENTQRKDVHSADLACRLFELDRGTYPGVAIAADGSGALPVPREIICERTGLTSAYVGNLIRAWGRLVEKVRREWRKKDIPTDIVIRWGKLKTEEEQIAALEEWKSQIAEVAARKAAGEKNVKAAGRSPEDSEGSEEAAENAPKKRKVIAEHLEKFMDRRESEKLSARDLDIVDAKIATLRWVMGETKRLNFT